jgi:hypothetical protein
LYIKVLDISLHSKKIPKMLKGVKHAEVDVSYSAEEANAMAEKDGYEFLIVKENKINTRNVFPPVL